MTKPLCKLLTILVIFYSGSALATGHSFIGKLVDIELSVSGLINAFLYVSAGLLAISSISKLRRHISTPTEIRLSAPLAEAFAALALFAIPSIFNFHEPIDFHGTSDIPAPEKMTRKGHHKQPEKSANDEETSITNDEEELIEEQEQNILDLYKM